MAGKQDLFFFEIEMIELTRIIKKNMRILSKYELLESSIDRVKQIEEELKTLKTEYHPRQVRGLCIEYKYTIEKIIKFCNNILDEEPEDKYGIEIDNRIKVSGILDRYRKLYNEVLKNYRQKA